jgi:hypothetical protein
MSKFTDKVTAIYKELDTTLIGKLRCSNLSDEAIFDILLDIEYAFEELQVLPRD